MKRSFMFIENPSEIGAGTRGASLGIDALKVASLNHNSPFFAHSEVLRISDPNSVLWKESPYKWAKYIDKLVEVWEEMRLAVRQSLTENRAFPIILSGDHSGSGGTIAGIKSAYPDANIGLIWIDAHADLHTPFTSPSGNLHGMPLAASLGFDHMHLKHREIDAQTHSYWKQLKNVGGISPKVKPEHLVFIGVRDTEIEEDSIMTQFGIRNFRVREVRETGPEAIAHTILHQILQGCDYIYISFDVDSMDSETISHGTGTPVPNGLLPGEIKKILKSLLQSPKISALEVTEINPTLDNRGNKMAEVAFDILSNVFPQLDKADSTSVPHTAV